MYGDQFGEFVSGYWGLKGPNLPSSDILWKPITVERRSKTEAPGVDRVVSLFLQF